MTTNDKKEFEAISEKLRNVKVIAKSNDNNDDFTVEFEIASILDSYKREEYQQVEEEINAVEKASLAEIEKLSDRVAVLNKEIDTLTNHADKTDYIVAVASGFLCGLLDSFFVGQFSLEEANKWGTDKIEEFVKYEASKDCGKEMNDIYDAIHHLENKYNIPSDNLMPSFGGATQHHLKDFAHHPNIVGLIFSILTQFTGKAYGIGQDGLLKIEDVASTDLIGKDFPTKISLGVVTWFFHLVSDVAGSTSSLHRNSPGTGLPGPIVSILYEISKIPFFNQSGNTEFSQWVTKLWNGTLPGLKERGIRFDMRTEVGLTREFGKQALPVVMNECVVRGFYFIRRLAKAIKETPVHNLSEFRNLNWETILPFKNRTIVRMITIASGTFTIVDLADAAIRSAMKNGLPTNPAFWASFVLCVNFIGIGRFAIALYADVSMGIRRTKLVKERRDAFIYRELEKDVVIQCELGKTQIALAKMYEFVQDVVENTFETMAQVVAEEEESFDAVAQAAQRRKEMINRVKIQKI
ncbi:MAG: hypothetical protein J6T70_02920 [Bacteroidales bacterium]|nr:hypothetical protein [Bacteroidales bacterium]